MVITQERVVSETFDAEGRFSRGAWNWGTRGWPGISPASPPPDPKFPSPWLWRYPHHGSPSAYFGPLGTLIQPHQGRLVENFHVGSCAGSGFGPPWNSSPSGRQLISCDKLKTAAATCCDRHVQHEARSSCAGANRNPIKGLQGPRIIFDGRLFRPMLMIFRAERCLPPWLSGEREWPILASSMF